MIPVSAISKLPDSPGVYRFYGNNDSLLYIGKSVRLRQRVRSRFIERPVDSRHGRMQRQVRRIDWTETAGELGALLMEAEEIKRRLQRLKGLCIALFDLNPESSNPITLYRDDALQDLGRIAREQGLCPKVLDIEPGPPGRPCFQHQVRRCRGACCGVESNTAHNRRLRDAMHASRMGAWP